MGVSKSDLICFGLILVFLNGCCLVKAEPPYKYFTWTITYGTAAPLNVSQQVILINGQFPGPQLDTVTNDNIVINVINNLDQPFLLTWNGIKQRKNSWQDGVLGTNCPILPNTNFTYKFQTKDQIGTYTYFPSTLMHKAAGGFGGLNVYARSVIPVPYARPENDFTLLIGDWYNSNHTVLLNRLDSGEPLGIPDGLLINGKNSSTFTGNQGKTYMFRISNVGLSASFNFRIQDHQMKLVEVEGSHVIQNLYHSLDVHAGQSFNVLVTLDQAPKDYYIVASTRFTNKVHTSIAILHYADSKVPVSGPLPDLPFDSQFQGSLQQARTFRWNLTSNAARPNPQGSYHYGSIPITKTFVFANSAPVINGKQRYAINGISYLNPDTPLKLADHFNISGVFQLDSIPSTPSNAPATLSTSVVNTNLHDFIEIVFQNDEDDLQSWHLNGHDFWVVGYGFGKWSDDSKTTYNLVDATTRHTVQVFGKSWTAIMVSLDNEGMWNLRSAKWERQYLGQQLYLRVFSEERSLRNEYNIPCNALLCGKAVGSHI